MIGGLHVRVDQHMVGMKKAVRSGSTLFLSPAMNSVKNAGAASRVVNAGAESNRRING